MRGVSQPSPQGRQPSRGLSGSGRRQQWPPSRTWWPACRRPGSQRTTSFQRTDWEMGSPWKALEGPGRPWQALPRPALACHGLPWPAPAPGQVCGRWVVGVGRWAPGGTQKPAPAGAGKNPPIRSCTVPAPMSQLASCTPCCRAGVANFARKSCATRPRGEGLQGRRRVRR